MSQIQQFYLTEFLKAQKYFTPVMILFLQFHHLTYFEIFVLYAVESILVFLLEIPSGIFADLYGKKRSLIIARISLLPAFGFFVLANSFWWFLAAMIFMGINKAFKSGTHKAYIYDYLEQTKSKTTYSEVIGKNKFWSKGGEALAASIGGWIAFKWGYNSVFAVALIPAILNTINVWLYKPIYEKRPQDFSINGHINHLKKAFRTIRNQPLVYRLIINSAIIVGIVQAAEKFFQPYMEDVAIPLAWFGPIYTTILLVTAFGARYAYLWEKYLSRVSIANISGWLIVLPLAVLTFSYHHPLLLSCFFMLIFLRTTRRPAMLSLLNAQIDSTQRATILSMDALLRALIGGALLPFLGLIADYSSIYVCFGVLGGMALMGVVVFRVR